jgi:hypothetical protein
MRIHADPGHDQIIKENRPLDTGRPTLVMHYTYINYYCRDAQKRETVGVLPPPHPYCVSVYCTVHIV